MAPQTGLWNSTLKSKHLSLMEQIDLVLEIDCLHQFYDWGKLTVSTVTNHTWTTAALSRDQSWTSQSQQSSCLFNQFTSHKFKNSWSCCYKRHCTGFQRGTGERSHKEKEGHWQNRLPWKQTEYSTWVTSRTQWSGLTEILIKAASTISKWARWPNNLSHGSLWTFTTLPRCTSSIALVPHAVFCKILASKCTCKLQFPAFMLTWIWLSEGYNWIPWSILSYFSIGFATATTWEFNLILEKITRYSINLQCGSNTSHTAFCLSLASFH